MVRADAYLAALALLAACTTPITNTEQQDIIGGSRSTGMTATVLLAGVPPNKSVLTTCTAVLVSPTVLFTSAHCIDAPNHPNYLFGIFTGVGIGLSVLALRRRGVR